MIRKPMSDDMINDMINASNDKRIENDNRIMENRKNTNIFAECVNLIEILNEAQNRVTEAYELFINSYSDSNNAKKKANELQEEIKKIVMVRSSMHNWVQAQEFLKRDIL